jgi:copper oxidase (laccase) domain-containing protein
MANRRQLEAVGVQSIHGLDRCTACHQDEFYSHRSASTMHRDTEDGASGEVGRTGRFAAVIGLRAM